MKTRKPKTINKHISELKKNITDNQERKAKMQAELNDLKSQSKADASLLDSDDFQQDLTRATTVRELAAENIQEAEAEVAKLEEELQQANQQQTLADAKKQCKDLAVKAEKLAQKEVDKMQAISELIQPHIEELNDLHQEHRQACEAFANEFQAIEPAIKVTYKNSEGVPHNTVRDAIDEFEEAMDVDATEALNNGFLIRQYYRYSRPTRHHAECEHKGEILNMAGRGSNARKRRATQAKSAAIVAESKSEVYKR
jgi:predicted  nucleic acid-binding Zn-ribbon protein